MITLDSSQLKGFTGWFMPERPGYLVGSHVLNTGCGRAWADRSPNAGALLAEVAGNYQFYGDSQAFTAQEIAPHLKGFIDCPPEFEPLLRAACPDLVAWERVVYQLEDLRPIPTPAGAEIRRLEEADTPALANLSPESNWVMKTWDQANGMAKSGMAWGAFVEGQLASIACPFFVGIQYEDLGVATEPAYRCRGLSTACTYALIQDVLRRGKRVSWNTSRDHAASIRVAEKLGFRLVRRDRLFVTGVGIPGESMTQAKSP
jgi:RimJ/RimL family protein N-acetyltransferase